MNSGFRGVIEGERTKVKALGLAVAVQLLLLLRWRGAEGVDPHA